MRLLITCLVAAGVGAVTPCVEASTIVFSCQADLCSLNPDSGRQRAITTNGTAGLDVYSSPYLSSDGRLLSFWYDDRAFVGDRNARERRTLRHPAGERASAFAPQFRPGSHEAFFFYGYNLQLFTSLRLCRSRDVIRARPRCGQTVQSGRAYWAWGPHGTIVSVDANLRQDICVTDIDGRCQKVLVRLPAPKTFFMPPSTSPNGRLIAAGVEQGGGSSDTRIELYSARSGRRVRTLTRGHNDYPPSFSPDGKRIVFSRDAVVEGGITRSSVCIVSTAGGRVRCPIRRGLDLGRPVWGG